MSYRRFQFPDTNAANAALPQGVKPETRTPPSGGSAANAATAAAPKAKSYLVSVSDLVLTFERDVARLTELGKSKAEAEDAAYHACLMHWQYRNPVSFSSAPLRQCGSCGSCGGPERAGDILLAIGIAPDQVWLHDGCWSAWHADRVAQAEASLAAIGIHRRTQS
ncbi:hypothetical protein [Bosea sp. NBC_00550]|uniref:hypothetical protein n=1 Tax=Bosea sp. NBC_00550 TaxID=2969621 RepID=UPI00222ECF82|nr:hypothetical protein [Bosea sp. NBC_00550]UZF92665.1 hypothetical protein NWE53_00090 [Bosea sp. NBC_00550]